MSRGLPAGALAVLVGLAPNFAPAARAQPVAALPDDYAEMVRLYASGETTAALWQLANWTEERVRKHNSNLSDAVVSIRKNPGGQIRGAFSRFPVRAALLLHADRETQEHFTPPKSEQVPECGSGPQAIAFEHLANILLLVDGDSASFVKRAELGMIGQAMWSHCFGEAAAWAHSALKRFPKDASLLLAEGTAYEARAYFTMAPAPQVMGLSPATQAKLKGLSAELLDLRERARKSFEDALASDPQLVEARLRLGRVLWRLNRPAPARAAFEAVLNAPAEAPQQYLAHLFLGRILEDSGDFAGAEGHYQVALSMQPLSEIAAVAVSHARFLQGDQEGARERLKAGLEAARKRRDFDPWMPYLLPQTPDGESTLTELRRSLTK